MKISQHSVPILFEEHCPSQSEFIEIVNSGYRTGRLAFGDYRRGRPVYQGYMERVDLDASLDPGIFTCFSNAFSSERYDTQYWEERFECFLQKSGSSYLLPYQEESQEKIGIQPEEAYHSDLKKFYIQKILIDRVKQFIQRCSIDHSSIQLESVESYSDYLRLCFDIKYTPLLELRWIDRAGWGIYAAEPIYPFMFFGIYGGIIRLRRWQKFKEFIRGYSNRYKWSLKEMGNAFIDAEKQGSTLRFVNHDSRRTKRAEPWIFFDDRGIPNRALVAGLPEKKRDVKAIVTFPSGEEIVWSYGYDFHF